MKGEIEKVRRTRNTRREAPRAQAPVWRVGYTNAGSPLLQRAHPRAHRDLDQLFATLDPGAEDPVGAGRTCWWSTPSGLSSKLPHALVVAFRATLEEVVEADLLLHVMDASAEDVEDRESAVNSVLKEIGAADRPSVAVLNKSDKVGPERARSLQAARPGSVVVSALTGEGLDTLGTTIARHLDLLPRWCASVSAPGTREASPASTPQGVTSHEVQGTR